MRKKEKEQEEDEEKEEEQEKKTKKKGMTMKTGFPHLSDTSDYKSLYQSLGLLFPTHEVHIPMVINKHTCAFSTFSPCPKRDYAARYKGHKKKNKRYQKGKKELEDKEE